MNSLFRQFKFAKTENNKMAPIESPRHSDIWFKGKYSPQAAHFRKSGLDPCKVLEPKRKTLQSLEAERIMTVFQDTVKRMEITTVLPHVLKSLPRFSIVLGQDLVAQMENHLRLQRAFKAITAELHRLLEQEKELAKDDQPRDAEVKSFVKCAGIKIILPEEDQRRETLMNQAKMLAKGIKNSLREILRYFKKNPKSIEAVLGIKQDRDKDQILLTETLTSLSNIMKERLLTSPLEEQEKKAYLANVIKREKKTNATREKLELKYHAAVKAKDDEIATRDVTIVHLQSQLQLIEKINTEQQRKTLTEAFKQSSLDSKASQAKVARYYEDMFECRKKIQEDKINHRETETHLRKRTFKMATEVYNWVQKYDADLDNRQEEYDLYTRMYEADKAELSELQARFEVLEKQYNAIMEERRLLEEEEARKLEEERQQSQAATAIQAAWRGYQFRKMMRSKAKKTGKKGKGGK